MTDPKKEFSLEELRSLDGTEGKPAYVVYQDRVIDVSASQLWPGGHHMGRHQAGRDMTREIEAAPHGPEVLERFPQVGVLRQAEAQAEESIPPFLARLFHRVPLLRRHPHPMLVHFPIVFFSAAAAFDLLFLGTGNDSFELTAWYCLWGGALFAVPSIATGLLTWWLNYNARFLRQVTIKLILSPVLLLLATALIIWRGLDPGILINHAPDRYLYLGGVLASAVLVSAIGWFGGTLSFPLEGE